jgi:CBS domain-containing protein
MGHLETVAPDTPLVEALERMGKGDVNQLPVMTNGHVEGLLSRGDLIRVMSTRAELHM